MVCSCPRSGCLSEFDADNVAGVKSIARREVDGSDRPSFERTGFAAYRATVDVHKMKADPEVSWLLDRPSLNIW
jgi:salicylate hydroxylase